MAKRKRKSGVPGTLKTSPPVLGANQARLLEAFGQLQFMIGQRNIILQDLDEHLTDRHREMLRRTS